MQQKPVFTTASTYDKQMSCLHSPPSASLLEIQDRPKLKSIIQVSSILPSSPFMTRVSALFLLAFIIKAALTNDI